MVAKFLDIKRLMRAVDSRDKQWYSKLTDDEKKMYSPYMTLKWTASVGHKERTVKEFYIEEANENLNKHLWTLSKNHKGLLWRLTAMCGSTFVLFHKWIYQKKTTTNPKSKMKELQEIFPTAKQKDLDVLDITMSNKEFTELKKQHGIV